MPEMYSPRILQWKAAQLRHLTGDDCFRSPLEFKPVSFPRRLGHALYRPILLFWTKPIIMIFGCYQTIIYISLYTFCTGFIALFQVPHILTDGTTGLTFLAVALGITLACFFIPFIGRQIHPKRHYQSTEPRGRAGIKSLPSHVRSTAHSNRPVLDGVDRSPFNPDLVYSRPRGPLWQWRATCFRLEYNVRCFNLRVPFCQCIGIFTIATTQCRRRDGNRRSHHVWKAWRELGFNFVGMYSHIHLAGAVYALQMGTQGSEMESLCTKPA